jgi:hypothetical protein
LLKAHHEEFARLAGVDPQYLRKILRFLIYGYDKFVHGHNITAMELYDGATNRFMLDGHKYPEKCREFKFELVACNSDIGISFMYHEACLQGSYA